MPRKHESKLFESDAEIKSREKERLYEEGQRHGAAGKSILSAGWYISDWKSDAWSKGYINGCKNKNNQS